MPKTTKIEDGGHGYIWNQVCDCESFGADLKDFLKQVEYGERSFTSIDAYAQIRKATEIFGPMGKGWGIKNIALVHDPIPMEKQTRKGAVAGYQMCFKGTFWWGAAEDQDIEMYSAFEVMEDIFLDTSGDSMKKVVTGMITKALSYLGWNYDVFCGRFNDAKGFDPPASDGEKARLKELTAKMKPEARQKILGYHETRGWLRPDVLADIRKIEEAMERSRKVKDASVNPDGSGPDLPVREDEGGEG